MKKYKLYRKDFQIWKDIIHILPTIEIVIDEARYGTENIALGFHFLVFHARLLWTKVWEWEE